MNKFITSVTTIGYRLVARPILFLFSPDSVHTTTTRVGVWLQQSSLALRFLRGVWAYEDALLGQTIQGIQFANPVGLSAGFDKNIQLVPLMKAVGFGLMEGGTITCRSSKGNVRPWFYRLPKSKSIVVHSGLANEGVSTIMERLRRLPSDVLVDFPLNISVAQSNVPEVDTEAKAIDDCIAGLRGIKDAGVARMITINISCPNTHNNEPLSHPKALERLLSRVDTLRLKAPLFLKMPCDLAWPDFNVLLRIAARHHVDGVTISNLVKDRQLVSLKEPLSADIKGGLSGRTTF